jgi:hypothetical protein
MVRKERISSTEVEGVVASLSHFIKLKINER